MVKACSFCGITYSDYMLNSEPCKACVSGYHPFAVMDEATQQSLAVDASQDGSQADDGSGSRH